MAGQRCQRSLHSVKDPCTLSRIPPLCQGSLHSVKDPSTLRYTPAHALSTPHHHPLPYPPPTPAPSPPHPPATCPIPPTPSSSPPSPHTHQHQPAPRWTARLTMITLGTLPFHSPFRPSLRKMCASVLGSERTARPASTRAPYLHRQRRGGMQHQHQQQEVA